MSESETAQYNGHMDRFRNFGASLRASEEQNTIRTYWQKRHPLWVRQSRRGTAREPQSETNVR